MTYGGFLIRFLVIPIIVLAVVTLLERRRAAAASAQQGLVSPRTLLLALAVIAVVYTTPWDNYLVATGVWWYDPALVLGIRLGWVPLEEYIFFVLQTALTGLLFLLLAKRLRPSTPFVARPSVRIVSTVVAGVLWLISAGILVTGWQPGTYLALVLVWALPPIGLQLALGGDILWHHWRVVVTGIVTPTLYLSAMDTLAIGSGTWTISPAQSLGVLLGGVLPVEEMIFFGVTNTLLVFGLTLGLAPESVRRLPPRMVRGVLRKSPPEAARMME